MDILRNIFGALTSGVIRLLVTVGILAAAYFFIVKPVLKSTTDSIKEANKSFEKSFGANGAGLEDISKTLGDVSKQVQVQITRSFHVANKNGSPKKLVRCIQWAHGNVHKIQRCTVKF
jgi:flagellar basal body-associated protein FliL